MSELVQSGEAVAQYLTEQFERWERRGRGELVWDAPVELEPPFRPFEGHSLPPDLFQDDAVETGLGSAILGWFRPAETPPLPAVEIEEPGPEYLEGERCLAEMQLSLPKDYQPSDEVFEQLLFSLSVCRYALSFEMVGSEQGIVAQIVADERDAQQVFPQLKAHFPEAMVTLTRNGLAGVWQAVACRQTEIREFGLRREFMVPLNTHHKLATDWLVAVCGALEYLGAGEVGVLQVLFQPARQEWARHIWRSVTTRDGKPFFEDAPEITALAKHKLAAPLYAVVVRVAVRAGDEPRLGELLKGLGGALALLRDPNGNELSLLDNDEYPDREHESDFLNRCSRRSGMLLNSTELVSFVHLPAAAVRSRKLNRRVQRTKEAPACARLDGVVLGINEHDGRSRPARLTVDQRLRHVHLIGNSGTGKSTLLLNLICQDIYQGRGVAVLDPHGDLIDNLLGYIPPERYGDVILFDAADDEYPLGFNILSAHTDLERTLLASDLVEVFKRLSSAWGDQMRSVLGNAVLAFLENSRVGTLPELRRFLIEPGFRKEILATVTDPEVTYYWEQEYPLLKSSSLGPLLTRLDEFLRRKTVRYIVGQRENKLDFGRIMDQGQILLARLPQGLIGEENSYMLGSLLVSKFHQLAIARQQKEAGERRPFFLYLDEFHHFVTPSLETILSGARKYGLGLTLAHQYVHQLQKAGDVGNAVLSMSGTRICFRVGDDDARKLAEGLADFATNDLQNLENYQAVGRIDRKDNDFNFRTIQPPELDEGAKARCDYLRYLSRSAYGTPRQKVEEELAKSRPQPKRERVDPFAKRTAKPEEPKADPKTAANESEPSPPVPEPPVVVPPPPPPKPKPASMEPPSVPALASQGKGGTEHKRWQNFVRLVAAQRRWTSQLETSLGEAGDPDVFLQKNAFTIICEIALTTPTQYEVQSIGKRLTSEASFVVVLSPDPKHLATIERLARREFGAQIDERVRFLRPELLADWLDQLDASQVQGEEVVGEMRVKYRAHALSQDEQKKRWSRIKAAFKRLIRPRNPES